MDAMRDVDYRDVEGNFIEAESNTTHFQTGEPEHGKRANEVTA